MMPGRFVLLTLGKELRETLRDRRTLTVMILFPLVIYPLLALMGSQVAARRERGQEGPPLGGGGGGRQPGGGRPVRTPRPDPGAVRSPPPGLSRRGRPRPSGRAGDGVADPPGGAGAVPQARAEIAFDATRDESRRASDRLEEQLEAMWPTGCAPRFAIARKDLAPESRLGGYLLSKALPLMILVMVLLGAFYPAIDVTAGERERGTLETVLASPIPRLHLLFGKVLAVTLLASASGILNLVSMSLTLVQVVNLAAPDAAMPVPWSRAAATGLIILPTAFLLAALFVAVGSLARSFKEAQNYLMPVYFMFFAPAMIGRAGRDAARAGLALVPGLNVSLLARDIALGKTAAGRLHWCWARRWLWGLVALIVAARSLRVGAVPGRGRPGARQRRKKPDSATASAGPAALGGRGAGRVRHRVRVAVLRVHAAAAAGAGARPADLPVGGCSASRAVRAGQAAPFRAAVGLHPAPPPAWWAPC
jgi:sodium transport system permease protein